MALQLDFEIHKRENNPISESFLNEHKNRFASDSFNVLCELIQGKRLSYKQALNTGLSGDLRARIHDLTRHMKLPITNEWVKTESGRKFKEYFMTAEDKIKTLEILVNKFKTV